MDAFMRRLITVIFALVLCVYVGYQIYQTTYTDVEVTNAVSHTVYDTIEAEAFIVRDETVIHANSGGYVYYTLENGDRISKNGKIAQVYSDEFDALTHQKIEQLNDQIETLQAIEAQGMYDRTNLDVINDQLAAEIKSLILSTHKRNYEGLENKRFDLFQLLCKRQLTTGKMTSLADSIAALKAKRQELMATSTGAVATIKSPVAGYFISKTDGLEQIVSYDNVLSATPKEVEQALKTPSNESAYTDSVGKVAGDYQWYLLCLLDREETAGIGVGKKMSVKLPFVSTEPIPVTVVAVNKDRDGRAAVVLQCVNMSKELSDIRHESLQIHLHSYTGLYVQDSALQFKEKNEPGVFVRIGNTCVFRRVEVLYHSESGKYSLCAQKDESGYLKLYDDYITKGKGLYDGKIIR